MKRLGLAVVGAGVLLAGPALACVPKIESLSAPRTEGYEPFAAATGSHPIDVSIRNFGSSACQLRLAVVDATPGNDRTLERTGVALRYELLTPGGAILPNVLDPGSAAPSFVIEAGQSYKVSLFLEAPAGQVKPSGGYEDRLTFRLLDPAGAPLLEHGKFVGLQVRARAEVNLAGTTGSFASGVMNQSLDLGELSDGAQSRTFIQVRANESVNVTMRSENLGELRNSQVADAPGILYGVMVDGETADLGSGEHILSRRPALTLDGSAYEMILTVPPPGPRFAGRYSDIITIDVTAMP